MLRLLITSGWVVVAASLGSCEPCHKPLSHRGRREASIGTNQRRSGGSPGGISGSGAQPAWPQPRPRRSYRQLIDELVAGYAPTDHPAARDYRGWRRYNSAPYLSATHGNLYINNYVNEAGGAYGRFENAGILPVGAIIAKDRLRRGAQRRGPAGAALHHGKDAEGLQLRERRLALHPDHARRRVLRRNPRRRR